MKEGYKTTEFWITLISYVVPILVLFGVITPDQAESVTSEGNALVEAIFNLLVALGPIVSTALYIWSRTKVKVGELPFVEIEEE